LSEEEQHISEIEAASYLRALISIAPGAEQVHLFGADAHMIHGVHHKISECTWPEMQCTGHPPRTDSAPNPSGGNS
jgi:hypothetical protein